LCAEELRGARRWLGRSERPREKSGLGKTVRALTRILVTVSSLERCGLNWYLVCPLSATETGAVECQVVEVDGFQIELIIELQWAE
jgi:hypothetical protein